MFISITNKSRRKKTNVPILLLTFFSKTLDTITLVAKNDNTQVNNTNVGFLTVKLTYVLLSWQRNERKTYISGPMSTNNDK